MGPLTNPETRQVTTLCRMCDHGCGMVVTVDKGIRTAVEGSRARLTDRTRPDRIHLSQPCRLVRVE